MRRTSDEFDKMEEGFKKLKEMAPADILKLAGQDLTSEAADINLTHAVFSEKGGNEDNEYVVHQILTLWSHRLDVQQIHHY